MTKIVLILIVYNSVGLETHVFDMPDMAHCEAQLAKLPEPTYSIPVKYVGSICLEVSK